MAGPTLKILYGPPGTGKTWLATRLAVRIISGEVAETNLLRRHQELVSSGQIIWVTFHPSFTYEDFVEGFRPESTEKGITYTPRPGPFRIACSNVTLAAPAGQTFFVGQKLESTTGGEYVVVSSSVDSVVVRNQKGKGAGLHTPVSFRVIERLRDLGYKPGDLSLPGTEHEKKAEIARRAGYDMQTLFGMTGPLRAVWEYAESTIPAVATNRKVVLVIDEINRADLSRVFGDIITLLEADKRLGSREEKRVMLPYSQISFGVPQELHIIGTMNTADRSLSVMDLALRRRFDFVEVPPLAARCAYPYAGLNLPNILTGWNRALSAMLGREKLIGHSYLEKSKLDEIRTAEGFDDSQDGELRAVAVALRQTILPQLLELFRGDWQRADFVLGRNLDSDTGGVLEPLDDSAIRARAGEYLDLASSSDYNLPSWWDPRSANWNGEVFSTRLSKVSQST